MVCHLSLQCLLRPDCPNTYGKYGITTKILRYPHSLVVTCIFTELSINEHEDPDPSVDQVMYAYTHSYMYQNLLWRPKETADI